MFQQNGENVSKSRTSELLKRNTALLLTHKKRITNGMLLGQAEREGTRDAQHWASSIATGMLPGLERQPRASIQTPFLNKHECC